jgi:predicted secreted protein
LLLVISSYLCAGDVANFVNLGFSEDAETFMFGQYGIDSEESKPFAELYAVDVAENVFETDGVKRQTYDVELSPGMDGSGALYTILGDSASLVDRYEINHLTPGRIVYLLVNGEEPESSIDFRDFNTGNRFQVELVQSKRGSGNDVRAAFHIQLSVTFADGTVEARTVGLPNYYRDGVSQYRISHIYLGPNEQSLVFVVQKERLRESGKTVRYMVETTAIDP